MPTYLTDHFNLNGQTAVTPAAPFGTNTALLNPSSNSTIKGTIQGSTTKYAFPASVTSGNFMMMYISQFSGLGNEGVYTPSLTNCSALNLFNANSTSSQTPVVNGVSADTLCIMQSITVTATGATWGFTNNGSTNTFTSGDFFVFEMPSGIN